MTVSVFMTVSISMTVSKSWNVAQFQRDLKRILVTLVESAQNILALNPEASKIFREAQEIMNQVSVSNRASSEMKHFNREEGR